jgi:hypothetical protein
VGSKGGRCVVPTNLPPLCADYLGIREAQVPGSLRSYPGLCRKCLNFTIEYLVLSPSSLYLHKLRPINSGAISVFVYC